MSETQGEDNQSRQRQRRDAIFIHQAVIRQNSQLTG